MNEFINEFGKNNFIIMISIIAVVIIALIIILIIENKNSKKVVRYEEEILESPEEEIETLEEVVYIDHEQTLEEAKEKLEAVTKKLIEDDLNMVQNKKEIKTEEIKKQEQEQDYGLIKHTEYESLQEEDSVISYDELVSASQNIDDINDKLLKDENEQAITIEELYKKHEEKQDKEIKIKVDNPVFEEEKTFKNSDIISPVFGIYKEEKEYPKKDVLKEINKTVDKEDLEDEIRKTEDFLEELKRLKSKLN